MRHTGTTYTDHGTARYAVRIDWADVTAFLGHEHEGDSEDDDALTQALCDDAGAPEWLRPWVGAGSTDGATDERGWYLLGPSIDSEDE